MIHKMKIQEEHPDNFVPMLRKETPEQRYHRRIGQTDRMNDDEDRLEALNNIGADTRTVTKESTDGIERNEVTPVPESMRRQQHEPNPNPPSVSTANLPAEEGDTKIDGEHKFKQEDGSVSNEPPKQTEKPKHRTAAAGR